MFSPSDFKRRPACVIGAGKSGRAAARLLSDQGFSVLMTDSRPIDEIRASLGVLPTDVRWEAEGPSEEVARCGFAVKSPGLSSSASILKKINAWGIPLFSELEVALAFSKTRRIAAITGTNGKTTTTALLGEIFRRGLPSGQNVLVCGNIGTPVSEIVQEAHSQDVLAIEASSYQLEDSSFFHPRVAAILNLKPDHLDHHGSFENYAKAKARIFRDQTEKDYCVFNASCPETVKLARDCPSQKLFFGGSEDSSHAWVGSGKIYARLKRTQTPIAFDPPKLPGYHNLENAMAAVLIALSFDLKSSEVQEGLSHFKGVEHRLEEAGTLQGLRCVNDSKATNVEATLVALEAFSGFNGRVLLILGGQDKGSPYAPLKPLISKLAKTVLTIGSAAQKIEEELEGVAPVSHCLTLEKAVQMAFHIGKSGDILLLSPACASFDQFQDFEDRGRQFKKNLKLYA